MNGVQIIKFCRPINLAAMAVSQVVVFLFLSSRNGLEEIDQWPLKIFLSIVVVVFIGAGGYWVNNIFDKEIDKINHAGKILVTDIFTDNKLWLVYGLLNMIGLQSSILIGIKSFFCAILTAALLFIYSYSLKKKLLIGNLLVAGISSVVVFFPLLSLNIDIDVYPEIRIYICFCMCISLARELIKDAEDIDGDQANGCATFPIVAGINATKGLVAVIIILLGAMIFHFTKDHLMAKRLYFWLMVQLPLFVLLFLMLKARDKKHFSTASQIAKGIMFTGLCSMLLN